MEQWAVENTLTSPADRDPARSFRVNTGHPPLTVEETQTAMENLVIKSFPQVERSYMDPPVHNQVYGLFSFVPAKGATPDKDGFYGFAKIRGSYATTHEALEQSEKLIRNVDSYHKIYHVYVGRPFPCTVSSKYSAETTEVDIKKKATEVFSEDIKQKKAEEQRTINEIKEREKKLLADTTNKQGEDDPYDIYTTLKVKLAQLSYTYVETDKKMKEMKNSILKTRAEIASMNEQSDDYQKKFYKKYMDARKDAGLPETDESFIKYMVSDIDIGF